MNRRKILTGLAAAPLAAVSVTVAVAATPEERIEAALLELAAAMQHVTGMTFCTSLNLQAPAIAMVIPNCYDDNRIMHTRTLMDGSSADFWSES